MEDDNPTFEENSSSRHGANITIEAVHGLAKQDTRKTASHSYKHYI